MRLESWDRYRNWKGEAWEKKVTPIPIRRPREEWEGDEEEKRVEKKKRKDTDAQLTETSCVLGEGRIRGAMTERGWSLAALGGSKQARTAGRGPRAKKFGRTPALPGLPKPEEVNSRLLKYRTGSGTQSSKRKKERKRKEKSPERAGLEQATESSQMSSLRLAHLTR